MDLTAVLLAALSQLAALGPLAAEYSLAQPLSNAARDILGNQRRKAAFSDAVTAALRDIENSPYRELKGALLDDFYLHKPDVLQELLKGLLVADHPDYARLQRIYGVSGLGSNTPDIQPALQFLVERIRKHAADKDEYFKNLYSLILQEKNYNETVRIRELLEKQSQRPADNDQGNSLALRPPPPKCRHLWGRDSFVGNVLNRLQDRKAQSIIYLSGGPGYGKTEAAREIAAKSVESGIFEGTLWVTAKPTEFIAGEISGEMREGLLTLNEFLNELATKLSCPLNEIQRNLQQRKLLIVLDNAETADAKTILARLSSMLEPSRALLTSRQDIQTPFLDLISVQGLEEVPSYLLLRDEADLYKIPELASASDMELKRVHTLTQGAPLALHFVVGRVLNDHSLDPVLADLEHANKQVEAFYRFCLEDAWKRLDESSKNVVRYIGHFAESSISVNDPLSLGNITQAELIPALAQLERWHLVQVLRNSDGSLRYDLHPWVRNSVRGHLVDAWQPTAKEMARVVEHRKKQMQKWKRN